MTNTVRGAAAIVGVGTTSSWNSPGYSALDQLGIAVQAAADDAGIHVNDIDGLFTSTLAHFMPALSVAEYLGIYPSYMDGTNIGGSSFLAHLLSATLALQAGLCRVACICYGSNQLSAGGKLSTLTEPSPWELPYSPRNPISGYALATARHMHEYGTTREHLAHVAVSARRWAQRNPAAYERGPLTVEDALASRPISAPLTLRDCCLVTDGGGAMILVAAERAGDYPKPPAYVLGVGEATTHRQVSAMADLTVTGAAQSGHRAFEMARVGPNDIDVLQLYDAFTINTILFLEDLGYCRKGEGGPFVASGAIAPGGTLPVNTNGGGLSCNHPGMYGIFAAIEAVHQVRGTAGDRQVEGAELALAHGNGGQLASQVTAILGASSTL
ncbi:thiolase [Pusillimonas sp. TS35]|nr:thiolase [Pusillimonas sp. TS35]